MTPSSPPAPDPGQERIYLLIKKALAGLFNLAQDTDEAGTVDSIKRGIEFAGGNLWSLVFAIFIASIGLNVNSTAVIIGAMLISPLMGPIMGAGLALGIFDFPLLRKSFRNLVVAATVSVLTSALYFFITPLSEAQSELLARTQPTIYDVLIALFGGSAGIVAGSRKDKTNAIPGVAIATALMPPLCTAGYGLANGNAQFFFGALYLFFINCIFIGLATIFFVRFLNFKQVTFVDPATHKRVRNIMIAFSVLTIIPSIYFGFNLVQEQLFRRNSQRFIKEALIFPGTRIISSSVEYNPEKPVIELSFFGREIDAENIEAAKQKLKLYRLENVDLRITQLSSQGMDSKEIEAYYSKNREAIKNKDDRIRFLEAELAAHTNRSKLLPVVSREISFLFPEVESFSFGDLNVNEIQSQDQKSERTVLVKWRRRPTLATTKKLELYLKSRFEIPQLTIITH